VDPTGVSMTIYDCRTVPAGTAHLSSRDRIAPARLLPFPQLRQGARVQSEVSPAMVQPPEIMRDTIHIWSSGSLVLPLLAQSGMVILTCRPETHHVRIPVRLRGNIQGFQVQQSVRRAASQSIESRCSSARPSYEAGCSLRTQTGTEQ
jgi:hypothetical protein